MRTIKDLVRILSWDIFHPDYELDNDWKEALNKWMDGEEPFEIEMDIQVLGPGEGAEKRDIPLRFYQLNKVIIKESDDKYSLRFVSPTKTTREFVPNHVRFKT